MGPHPFPYMVRQLQSVVGDEARHQCRELLAGADPDVVVACVGGGSNAAGTFAGFVDTDARLVGVEAAGGAAITNGIPGRAARHALAPAAGRGRPDPRGGVDLGRARLPGPRVPSTPTWPPSGGPSTPRPATPRCSRPSSCSARPRASSPPSSRRTPWPGWRECRHRRPARRVHRADHPVGPRRQGRGPGPRDARPPAPMPDLEAELRARRDSGRKLLIPYLMGGMTEDWRADPGRRGGRRRRRGGGRHPLLGPDDGRTGDPRGGAAGAAARAPCPTR